MKLLIISKQSLKAIFTNKGRSFLTILGIVIGIGSVIALISLGNGVKAYISREIGNLGTTTLTITPGAGFGGATQQSSNGSRPGIGGGGGGGEFGRTSSLSVDDYTALIDKTKNPDVNLVGGSVTGSSIYNDQRYAVAGVTISMFQIRAMTINHGVIFTQNDIANKSKVMVLGGSVAESLFGITDPIGKTLAIGTDTYTVTGVFNKVTGNNFNDPNLNAYVPYTSAMNSLGVDRFSTMVAIANNDAAVDKAKSEIQNTLLAGHNIKDIKLADFSVSTPADLLSTVGNITGILTSLLSGIAAISLLVGGIGIMNIMLVSVTERTREIGLRKAVGAKISDILTQFLIEAILLTLTGGILGIALGVLMATIAGRFIGFSPVTTSSSIILAVGISTLVGLIFGIYPAIRAARLNPIDALRYE